MTIRQSLFIIEYQKPGRWDELKIRFIYFRIESLLSLDVDTINWGIIPLTITPNFYMQMDGISDIGQNKSWILLEGIMPYLWKTMFLCILQAVLL